MKFKEYIELSEDKALHAPSLVAQIHKTNPSISKELIKGNLEAFLVKHKLNGKTFLGMLETRLRAGPHQKKFVESELQGFEKKMFDELVKDYKLKMPA